MNYNEVEPRGSADFPITWYHLDRNHLRYVMRCHWHFEPEIIRVLSGGLDVRLDEDTITAREGDIIFINSGLLHAAAPKNCVYECIVFEWSLLSDNGAPSWYEPFLNRNYSIEPLHTDASDPIYTLLWSLFEAMANKTDGQELIIRGLLLQFFGCVFSHGLYRLEHRAAKSGQTKIKKALRFIETNYNTSISLNQISALSEMSPKYFCRVFKETTGRTPVDYLNYYRVYRAASQLKITEDSVTEIAYRCGFSDLSYFIKTFRRYKGVTPHRFRADNM